MFQIQQGGSIVFLIFINFIQPILAMKWLNIARLQGFFEILPHLILGYFAKISSLHEHHSFCVQFSTITDKGTKQNIIL